jgi:hypothetical protein
MASITGPKGLHLAPTLKEQPAAPAAEGEFAGKSVTVGGALKTIGRVALGIVTLGISELVIRLAQRGRPEVVPTTEPGRAAQALNLAHAEAPHQEKDLKRVLGDGMYASFLAKARDRATAEGEERNEALRRQAADPDGDMYTIKRYPYAEAAEKLTEPELVAYHASTDKNAYEQLRAGGKTQEKQAVLDTFVDSAVKKLTPASMSDWRIARYDKEDMRNAIGDMRYDYYCYGARQQIDGNIKKGAVEPEMAWKLPEPMTAAFNLYTDGQIKYYRAINAEMTRNKPEERDDMTGEERRTAVETRDNMLLIAGVLDHALEKLEPAKPKADEHGHVPEYLTSHRGADLTAADLAKYVPGNVVTEPRYTSTSASLEKAFEGNTQFVIMGKSGRDISFCSKYPDEQEILYPCDTPFEVLHHEKAEDGTTRIVMKEIEKEPE